ncbi:MAG: hypothetical protein KF855_14370 [Acidobacteria bacterium]|nr:hypothetical protein [Acidobacteriota bacterium]
MQTNAAHKFAPVVTDDKRIDLKIEGENAAISLSLWTDGLGWCTQKTMTLDADLLDDLHRVIAAARLRIRNDADSETSDPASARVINFPSFA